MSPEFSFSSSQTL